ncbi:shikimate kinase, partial [Gilvibacter sp.]|uniref:shikimate kinase n=1 Tax=Gilvibacter sp. TaxID=2729997 RepID=UPI003F4A0641
MSKLYIIMGVSGSGKTTVGEALARELSLPFLDADTYHPQTNIEKMQSGQALNDQDREPWLVRLNEVLAVRSEEGAVFW